MSEPAGAKPTRFLRDYRAPAWRIDDVELVFDPPWSHSMMSDVAKLETGML